MSIFFYRNESRVRHYRIMKDKTSGKLFIEITTTKFANLRELVDMYVSSGDKNGLECAVKEPFIELGAGEYGKHAEIYYVYDLNLAGCDRRNLSFTKSN